MTSSKIEVFAEGLDHPEGVAAHPDGSVWCGGEIGQIYRIDPSGKKVEEVANTGGFALGLAFSPAADWLAVCDIRKQAVFRLDLSTLKIEVLLEKVGEFHLRIPNYPVFSRQGTLYVSDSGDFNAVEGRIFRVDASGKGEFWAGGALNFANGLALEPDESHLYVVESFLPGVSRYRIQADGSAGPRELFVNELREVPDGLAFDCQGNLYCSCYAPSRIYRIDRERQVSIQVEDLTSHALANCTNIAFGGPDFRWLFAANLGRWHIARIEMDIPGAPLACHASLRS
jgi:sugar lactone lactonase YvrE